MRCLHTADCLLASRGRGCVGPIVSVDERSVADWSDRPRRPAAPARARRGAPFVLRARGAAGPYETSASFAVVVAAAFADACARSFVRAATAAAWLGA